MSAQPSGGRAEHGSLAEETARLFEALQEAAGTWSRGAGEPGGAAAHDHAPTPAACRVCPLCQVIAAVQHVKPETVQHLADAAASLAAAVSDLVAGSARGSGAATHGDTGGRLRREDVQHIDISD